MTGRVAFALALFGCWAAAAETARPHDNTAAFQNIRSLIDKGQYAQAETAARELVAQVESAAGPDSLETGESLDLLVEALWQGGKGTQPESRELAERAVAIKEESPGTTELSLALSLFHLAAFRSAAGEYAEAKPIFERVLQVRQTQLGPNHPDVAFTLNVFGASRRDAGDLAEARRLIEQGLAIREQTLGPEHLLVAGSLNNLASVLFSVHDYAAIGPLLERAIAIWEKALGPDHPRVGLGVSNLAALHAAQRDFAGARPLFERGLAIQEKTLGPEHPSVALTLSNLAKAMEETGDLAAARPLVERSLAIREKVFGSEHPEVAKSLAELATLLTDLGDYAAAGPLFQRALDIGEKVAGPRHPILVEPLFNMAVLLARTGKTNEAAATAFRADDIAREHGRLISRTLAEREALAYSSGRTPTLTLVLTLIAERRDQAAQFDRAAWDAVVRSRSIVLDEMAARHRSISGIEDPEIDRLAKGLTSARELLAKLLVRGPGDEPAGQYRDLLDQARQDEEKAERTLAEKNAAFRAEQARDKLGFDDVAWALPRGAALVAFATYGRVPIEKGQLSAPPQEPIPYYLAFVLNSTTEKIASVPLGTVAEIDGLVANVRRQIEQEARYVSLGRAAARNEAAYRTAGAALRARIWEPLQPHVAGAQRVFVVPDGALNFVSFSALPVGRDQYLIETGTVVHYLSAERDLIPRDAGQRGGGLLAVGAPAFDDQSLFATLAPPKPPKLAESRLAARGPATPTYRGQRSACGSFEAMSFEALPAAEREAEEIAKLWRDSTRSTSAPAAIRDAVPVAGPIRVLTGAAASEAAVKEEARGHRILHLATHGFFLGGRCTSAFDPVTVPGEPPPGLVGENPLLLAGLALAGANHRAAAGVDEEDGILTAEEIAALDLDGVEWAVLSACDTGAGEVKASEGVFGLRRAFQVAGAKAVIMSLWPVEDSSARDWMTTLYRNRLTSKLDTAEAVRSASLTILQRRREQKQSTHPFFWAGFVAAGDWH